MILCRKGTLNSENAYKANNKNQYCYTLVKSFNSIRGKMKYRSPCV